MISRICGKGIISYSALLQGGTIRTRVREGFIYDEIYKNRDALYTMLLTTGYLTAQSTLATVREGLGEALLLLTSSFDMAEKAIAQIAEKAYMKDLQDADAAPIYRYGIAFCGKRVCVKMEV